MIQIQDSVQLNQRQLCDGSGRKVGRIVAIRCVITDPRLAEWALISTGAFSRARLVPLYHAHLRTDGKVYVPYPHALILASPPARMTELDDPRRSAALRAHYRLGDPSDPAPNFVR